LLDLANFVILIAEFFLENIQKSDYCLLKKNKLFKKINTFSADLHIGYINTSKSE